MAEPFGGPLGKAGNALGIKYLDDFRELIPAELGRADSDAGAIGAVVLCAFHRLVAAGATTEEISKWQLAVAASMNDARAVVKLWEGK